MPRYKINNHDYDEPRCPTCNSKKVKDVTEEFKKSDYFNPDMVAYRCLGKRPANKKQIINGKFVKGAELIDCETEFVLRRCKV